MRRVKRKFLLVAGLFISGLNPLWATSSQKINSQVEIIKELNKNQIQEKKETKKKSPSTSAKEKKSVAKKAKSKPSAKKTKKVSKK